MISSTHSSGGVERNAASRFVDYSCATEWEKFLLSVESDIRSLVVNGVSDVNKTHSFSGTKVKISLRCGETTDETKTLISSLFNSEDRYILVSRTGKNWLDCTTSAKHTLFSALITAAQSCSGSLGVEQIPPIFFTTSGEKKFDQNSRKLDIMGYQICKRLNSSIVVNFSSIHKSYSSLEDIKEEEFRYVDSLSELFSSQLTAHHRGMDQTQVMHLISTFMMQVTEVCSKSFSHLSLHQSSKVPVTPYASSMMSPHLLSLSDELWLSLPLSSGHSNSKEYSSNIKKINLSVSLVYPTMKVSSVVDNAEYTSLVAAKQPPSSWSIKSTFNSVTSEAVRGPDSGDKCISAPLSTCLRRLLALFITCKSCVPGVTMTSLSSEVGSGRVSALLNEDKAMSVAAVLSEQSKQAVLEMFSSEVERDARLNDLLLTHLFQSDEVSESGTDSKYCSVSQSNHSIADEIRRVVKECAGASSELLSLYAVCSGSLQGGVVSIANLWARFLLVLRSLWEGGMPVPRSLKHPQQSLSVSLEMWKRKTPLYDRLLWDDVLLEKIPNWHYNGDIINQSFSILGQKLQALHFCILVKDESILYRSSTEEDAVPVMLQRRLPLTGDVLAQKVYILQKLAAETQSDYEEKEFSLSSPLDLITPYPELDRTQKNDDIVKGNGNEQETIDIDNTESSVTSSRATQLQCWQIEMDVIISDMRAWKAVNSNSYSNFNSNSNSNPNSSPGGTSFDEFLRWYIGEIDEVEDEGQELGLRLGGPSKETIAVWSILWTDCSPACSAAEQKVLFNAEAEAEKVLGLLSSLSPCQLASQLLMASIATVPIMLWSKVERHVTAAIALVNCIAPTTTGDDNVNNRVRRALGQENELQELCDLVREATREIEIDTLQFGSEERRTEAAVSQRALQLVDHMADIVSKMETYCQQALALCDSLSTVALEAR
jgi:hypothetical protein